MCHTCVPVSLCLVLFEFLCYGWQYHTQICTIPSHPSTYITTVLHQSDSFIYMCLWCPVCLCLLTNVSPAMCFTCHMCLMCHMCFLCYKCFKCYTCFMCHMCFLCHMRFLCHMCFLCYPCFLCHMQHGHRGQYYMLY